VSLLTAAVLAVALSMFALAAGTARAACGSSTASGPVNFHESTSDAEAGAPDIGTINNALDTSCHLRTEVLLVPLNLEPNQYLIVQYDRDESTGARVTEAVDVEVHLDANGAVLHDGTNPAVPLPTFGQYGFTVTLDQLGITRSPMSLGVAVDGVFDPTPAGPGGDETYDNAPDIGDVMHRVPVSFSAPLSPALPPVPAAPATKKAKSCIVPKLKRLTVRKAKRRLKKAGCKYKVKGRGRVRWTSPKAGTRTIKTVRVRAKRTPSIKR
jgi:hypothetical protein